MSRAFVKETDGEDLYDSLPDRPIDPRPNLVTAEGLAQIEQAIARLLAARAEAEAKNDRAALAESARDLRYWQARRASAELMPMPDSDAQTRFGHSITLRRDSGGEVTWRIVGIDEADPAQGRLSYVAPMAQALLGKRIGDEIDLGKQGIAEIVAISAS